MVHDAHLADPSFAFGLSRLTDAGVLHRAPIGIFRDVDAPAYDGLAREQIELARGRGDSRRGPAGDDQWWRHLAGALSRRPAFAASPGHGYGLAAYALWGAVPLFWPLVSRASALELLAHRVIWSLVICVILLLTVVPRGWWGRIGRPRSLLCSPSRPRSSRSTGAPTSGRVNHGHVVETSLGYYINPILSILVGVIFLSERLAPLQWVSVGLAGLAVVVLTVDYGRLPWIALVLAASFATYGVIKKQVNGGAVETLTVESALLTPIALGYLLFLQSAGTLTFGHLGLAHNLLLMASGLVTVVPLLFFTAAATRLPLSTLGLVQYVAPTLQFLLGVLYFRESMSLGRWIGFALVWLALVILTTYGIRQARLARRPAVEPVAEPV